MHTTIGSAGFVWEEARRGQGNDAINGTALERTRSIWVRD